MKEEIINLVESLVLLIEEQNRLLRQQGIIDQETTLLMADLLILLEKWKAS
jgi:hypothetical protein